MDLTSRGWDVRDILSHSIIAYDAPYVALAESEKPIPSLDNGREGV